jgi:hypothetical protein
MSPIANLVSEALLTLGIAVIAVVLLLRAFRVSKRCRVADSKPAENEATSRKTTAHEKYALWEVEIEERFREVEARLDNKIAALEYLLNEAESVLGRLESHVQRGDEGNNQLK